MFDFLWYLYNFLLFTNFISKNTCRIVLSPKQVWWNWQQMFIFNTLFSSLFFTWKKMKKITLLKKCEKEIERRWDPISMSVFFIYFRSHIHYPKVLTTAQSTHINSPIKIWYCKPISYITRTLEKSVVLFLLVYFPNK